MAAATQHSYTQNILFQQDWLEEGFLPKNNSGYGLRYLNASDIQDIVALQDKVYENLSESEKNFIVLKPKEFFENHLAKGHPMIGAFCNGQLIAQSIIRAPSAVDRHIGMTDMEELQCLEPENITILQGVLCDPAYRGNGLMNIMVDHWLKWALDNDRHHALAEIEVRNHHSWSVFMKQGMLLVSMGRDENDGANLYNAFQDLSEETGKVKYRALKRLGAAFSAAVNDDTLANDAQESPLECRRNDLASQHALMKQGYACSAWDSGKGVMHYKKRPF